MARKCVYETFKSKDQILWVSLNFQVARDTYHFHGITRHSSWKIKWITTFHLESFRKCGSGGGDTMFVLFSVCFPLVGVACEQALKGRKRKESLQTHLWNLNSSSNSPVAPRQLSCQISANSRRSGNERKINVNKHWKTHAKGNDVVTVISTNQHFASTFLMQIFKLQRHSCKLSFLFPPCPRDHAHRLL